MRTSSLVLSALLLVPALALAQRGGGGRVRGERTANWDSIASGDRRGLKLSNRDVENISPLKLLIDKRKDLKLSDDQVKSLKDIEAKLKETNKPSFQGLDSLRRLAQPPLHDPSDEERARMNEARRTVGAVVFTIRQNYDASLKEALPLLDDAQRATANELLEKQRQEAQEMLREKMGGRG